MNPELNGKHAVVAIRVSTSKQGTDGDSPEAQKEQLDRFTQQRGLITKKYFTFLESASKEQQPMQEAIDYCKDPKNNIQFFIIKSIDRFTRGGSDFYGPLKRQLEQSGVTLIDIYGVIGATKINTLEHTGFEYKWSIYSPTKKSEILEAERAQDEMRDIMSRMIGAEIRYTQIGYWMRQPPYGCQSQKIETSNGKRCVLTQHPVEAPYILKMFELRSQGFDDREIIERINHMGFLSRLTYKRDKHDRTRIIRRLGGKPLNQKMLARIIENPIYAGVICEKWTNDQPVKAKFDGLVSFELFNKANRGRLALFEEAEKITLYRKPPPEYLLKKGVRNEDFPFRRHVLCPKCKKPLFGSATRGKLGKYYPAYHCHREGHYFRVPKAEFDETISRFVKNLEFSQDYIDELVKAVLTEWDKRQAEQSKVDESFNARIEALQAQTAATVEKIKYLQSETAIKYMEEDLVNTEKQISELQAQQEQKQHEKPTDMRIVMAYIKYFLEHLDYLLLKQIDPIKKASFFGLFFNKTPSYAEIQFGTQNPAALTGVNELFNVNKYQKGTMVSST